MEGEIAMERPAEMNDRTADQPEPSTGGLEAVMEEIRSTRETAEHIAHDGPSPGADVPRVLAGLLSHLAEQVERLAGLLIDPSQPTLSSGAASVVDRPDEGPSASSSDEAADAMEEDISPQDAPAEPGRDPKAEGSDPRTATA